MDEELKEEKNEETVSFLRVPNFVKHYVTNIKGGLTTQDFRYELMNEKIYDEEADEWTYIADALVILSPRGCVGEVLGFLSFVFFYPVVHLGSLLH